MQVETFECEETATETPEMTEEAIRLATELGLQGQLDLTKQDDGQAVRLPYREMTADERFVYKTLLPEKTDVTKYGEEPMPVRVMQVAAHAKQCGMFDRMTVWHRKSAVIKDPVLVGEIGDQYRSDRKFFYLARWGDVLEEFPSLCTKALTAWRENAREKLEEVAAQVKNDIDRVGSVGISGAMNHNGVGIGITYYGIR